MIKRQRARTYENSQEEIVNFLAEGGVLSSGPVQHIQTHISHIFLTEDRAFKMKRAVWLNFADLRQKEQRHAASLVEFRLNRRTTHELYLGWRSVYRDGSHLAVGALHTSAEEAPQHDPLEYLVEMARFSEADLLSNRVLNKDVPPHTFDKVCEEIIQFHDKAEHRLDCGGFSAMRDNVANIHANLATYGAHLFTAEQVENWYACIVVLLDQHANLLNKRRERGFVRQCHGDLHLANIYLDNGQPRLFDCIDFSEELACIDVLYDLAFLLMDLMHRGLEAETSALLNRYLAATLDYDAVSLLPLFVSVRAAIRAMIGAIDATEHPSDHHHAQDARAHFELALACLQEEPLAQIIALGGYSGTGKSTLAKSLAAMAPLHAFVLSSDVIRKRQFGATPEQKLPKAAYASARSADVYDQLMADIEILAQAGVVVIADATFLQALGREQLEEIAERIGIPFTGCWLDLPLEAALQRVTGRHHDPSDADEAVLRAQRKETPGMINWVKLDASAPDLPNLILPLTPPGRGQT